MRVLTAIVARSSSTGAPLIDVVVVGRFGAGGEERRVERATEPLGGRSRRLERRPHDLRRRRIERSVHNGERAASDSDSWVIAPRMPSTAAAPAVGIEAGSASSSPTWRAMLIGSRNVAWT